MYIEHRFPALGHASTVLTVRTGQVLWILLLPHQEQCSQLTAVERPSAAVSGWASPPGAGHTSVLFQIQAGVRCERSQRKQHRRGEREGKESSLGYGIRWKVGAGSQLCKIPTVSQKPTAVTQLCSQWPIIGCHYLSNKENLLWRQQLHLGV